MTIEQARQYADQRQQEIGAIEIHGSIRRRIVAKNREIEELIDEINELIQLAKEIADAPADFVCYNTEVGLVAPSDEHQKASDEILELERR